MEKLRRMKRGAGCRWGVWLLCFLLVFGMTGEVFAVEGGSGSPAEEAAPAPPKELPPAPAVSARTAVVMELHSGAVLYEKGMNEKAYPASTTKILTGLLAVEAGNLQEKIKISENAAGTEGSSIYLAAGETVKMEDLLYGLMLRSGNDAAIAIAEGVAGSTEAFVDLMNQRAAEIGAENSHFVNPNGLFDENHYTTAYDMALIAREAMQNQVFHNVAGCKLWTADRAAGRYIQFYNKNKVVFDYQGGTGVKIGYTVKSGRTLVASAERGGMELICVVMEAPDWFQDSYALMDYVYANYGMMNVAEGQRILKTMKLRGGDKDFVYIGTKESAAVPVRADGSAAVFIEYDLPKTARAPVSRWQQAGQLKIYVDNALVCTEPLYYLEDIPRSR